MCSVSFVHDTVSCMPPLEDLAVERVFERSHVYADANLYLLIALSHEVNCFV